MPVGGVGGVGGINLAQLAESYRNQVSSGAGVGGTQGVGAASSSPAGRAQQARGADFANAIEQGLNQVAQLDKTASDKAVQAATGDLTDVHDYVIAATQAQVATELTTTVRNKALESFNEIMRMPL